MESINHQEREFAVLNEYGVMAQRHIELSHGRMDLLATNPETYPAQQLDCHWIEGDRQRAGMVEFVATQADSRFSSFIEKLKEPEQQRMFKVYGEILKRGDNILLVTNHSDTIDIALALAGPYCMLDQMDYATDIKTGIIISKMISRLGYILEPSLPSIPAVDVLKLCCDDVFLSFPRTDSMRKSKVFGFVPDHIDRHNRKIRGNIRQRQQDGDGYLLAIAGSGTTDKSHADDPNSYTMGILSEGSIEMMQQPNTFVLPMAVWLHNPEAVFEFCDLRAVKTQSEAHMVMQDIAQKLNVAVPEKQFLYRPSALGGTALARPRDCN